MALRNSSGAHGSGGTGMHPAVQIQQAGAPAGLLARWGGGTMSARRDEQIAAALKSAYEAGRLAIWFDRPVKQLGPVDPAEKTQGNQTPENPPEWHH